MHNLNVAKSFLFVPGDRPERFEKARAAGAHAVIIDLEDAVAPEDKPAARKFIEAALSETDNKNVLIRINDAQSTFFGDDVALIKKLDVAGIILPKAHQDDVLTLSAQSVHPIWPLVETAQGVDEIKAISNTPQVTRFLLGTIDLSLQLGLDLQHPAGQTMMDHARFSLILNSTLSNLPQPVDGVFPELQNAEGLKKAALHARASGMGGMMCIHPSQVNVVNAVFSPDEQEIEWAQAVLEMAKNEKSSFQFRDQMIDKPILERAKKVLADQMFR